MRSGPGPTFSAALAGVAAVLASASAVALLATSGWLIVRAADQPPMLTLMVAIVGVRAFGLGRGVFRYLERLLGHDVAFRVQADRRVEVFRRLERITPVPDLRSGDLVAKLVADVDSVVDRIVRVLLPFCSAALVGAATAGLLASLLPAVGAVATVAVGLVLIGVPWLVRRTGQAAEGRIAPLRGRYLEGVSETLRAAPELWVFGASERWLERSAAADARLRRAEARSAFSAGMGAAAQSLLFGAVLLTAVALGVPAVRSGTVDHVTLAVLVLAPLALLDVFGFVPAAAGVAVRARAAQRRVEDLVRRTPAVPEPDSPVEPPSGPYTLVLDAACARGVRPIDLTLRPGARVAVTGPSGSGKTTVTELATRLLAPDSGRVLLNGIDLAELDSDRVRELVKVCEQDPYVFDSTVAENLRLARPDASDDELRAALRSARLSMPLHRRLGEHGERMSGGERQRLGLARCLLADAPIVLYDEPTEHLESDVGEAIVRDLLRASADRTVLIATHRRLPPDVLSELDQVLRLGPRPPVPPGVRELLPAGA